MGRGDVYLCRIDLPNRSAVETDVPTNKLVVLLQGGPPFDSYREVAVVVASTWRGVGSPRPFEVVLGPADGFRHDTVVDCRWPFTLPKTRATGGRRLFTLSEANMHAISLALARGLQLR